MKCRGSADRQSTRPASGSGPPRFGSLVRIRLQRFAPTRGEQPQTLGMHSRNNHRPRHPVEANTAPPSKRRPVSDASTYSGGPVAVIRGRGQQQRRSFRQRPSSGARHPRMLEKPVRKPPIEKDFKAGQATDPTQIRPEGRATSSTPAPRPGPNRRPGCR